MLNILTNLKVLISTGLIILSGILGFNLKETPLSASPVVSVYGGGTGTSTVPTFGQMLVGLANGTYAPSNTIGTTTVQGLLTGTDGANFSGTITSTAIVLGTGQVLTAGSFATSTIFDFRAGNNTGANAFRIQFYESLASGIKNSGGYIQYESVGNYLEFGGIQTVTGADVPGFRIARDTGTASFFSINLPTSTVFGGLNEYAEDVSVTLAGKTNSVSSSKMNFWEIANSGGYIRYDGSANNFIFGTQSSASALTDAFAITRGSAIVNFNSSITTGKVIGGSAVGSSLALQGTSGNGTLASTSLKFLVGNNGATEAMTILNNGDVGIGDTPSYDLDIQKVTAGGSVDARLRNLSTTGYAIYRGDADTASLKFGSYGSAYATTQYRNNSVLTTDGTKLRIANTSATGVLTFHMGGQTDATEKMRLSADGYLGIGTTTPKSALQVTGTGTTTLWIGEFGKVGQFCLGTASTTASVCCYGDVTTGGLICNTTSTY